MKKRLFALLMAVAMVFALTACGGGGSESEALNPEDFDYASENNIIFANYEEGWELNYDSTFDEAESASFECDASEGYTWNYLDVWVTYEKIYDYTASSNRDTILSYIYAEDIEYEEAEAYGMTGYKYSYYDTDAEKYVMGYTLAYIPEGSEDDMGYTARVGAKYIKADEETVIAMMEAIQLDFSQLPFFPVEEE